MNWILVGVGGALGSIARHGLNQWVLSRPTGGFPLGIFVINILGSVAIGVIAGAAASGRWTTSPEARAFLMVGVLGGFTTFSSFSLDTLTLIRSGQAGYAIVNVAGQVVLSLLGVAAGYSLFRT
jgi:fluoride exporter